MKKAIGIIIMAIALSIPGIYILYEKGIGSWREVLIAYVITFSLLGLVKLAVFLIHKEQKLT